MKRWIAAIFRIIAVLSIPLRVSADFNGDSLGTTSAGFLKLGVGARAAAMGEAFAAVADDATALYWNPAGLSRLEGSAAAFMHAPHLASTFYDFAAYAHRFGRHAIGGGVQYFSAGRLDQTDDVNTALGSFHPYDVAGTVAYAFRLGDEGLSIGAAGKYIQSKILETASAFAVDFGLLSRLYADRYRFALTAANIGSQLKFENESEDLPLAFRVGSSIMMSLRWLLTLDITQPRDNHVYIGTGTEYLWRLTDSMTLAARAGYNSRTTGDVSGLTGYSLGTGLGFERFAMDYAVLPYGGVGITHRISLSFKWSNPGPRQRSITER